LPNIYFDLLIRLESIISICVDGFGKVDELFDELLDELFDTIDKLLLIEMNN